MILKLFFVIFISKVSTKSLLRTNRIRGSLHSSNKTLISKLRSFKFIVSLMFVSLLLANSYQIILPEIFILQANSTPIEYTYTKNVTYVYEKVDTIYGFLILCLLNIVIVIFNVITLIKTHIRLKSKRAMTNNNASSSAIPLTERNERASQDLAVRARKKISKAEINISLMVFISGIVEIFGNISPFIYILNTPYEDTNVCLITFFFFLAEISYTLSFFIYFSFDMNFRKCFFSFFVSVWNWFHNSNSYIETGQNQ